MIIIEVLAPMNSKIIPEALLVTTYLVWSEESTEERRSIKITLVKSSIENGECINVDHVIPIAQRMIQQGGSTGISPPIVESLQLDHFALGPYSINLKALGYHTICHGKIPKSIIREVVSRIAKDQAKRDTVDRLIEPAPASLAETFKKK